MNESKQRLGHRAVVFVYNTLCTIHCASLVCYIITIDQFTGTIQCLTVPEGWLQQVE